MQNGTYTNSQLTFLVLLRWLIGWHFLYEGIVKITNPAWTSQNYLSSAEWLFKGLFQSIAGNENVLHIVDFTNQWALVAIGLALLLGIFSRYASMAGVVLLILYYVVHPPFFATSPVTVEGSYIFVNKNLIEACAMMVLIYFPTSHIIGLERLFRK